MIRRARSLILIGIVSLLAAGTASAALRPADALPAQDGSAGASPVIPSSAGNALDTPDQWSCTRILPEYQAWLEAGNATTGWKYFGTTYRNETTGELYDWSDWLRWARDADCAVGPHVESEFAQLLALPLVNGILGGVITAAGAGGLFAASGNADSPG